MRGVYELQNGKTKNPLEVYLLYIFFVTFVLVALNKNYTGLIYAKS